jgi:hypothetical protein
VNGFGRGHVRGLLGPYGALRDQLGQAESPKSGQTASAGPRVHPSSTRLGLCRHSVGVLARTVFVVASELNLGDRAALVDQERCGVSWEHFR